MAADELNAEYIARRDRLADEDRDQFMRSMIREQKAAEPKSKEEDQPSLLKQIVKDSIGGLANVGASTLKTATMGAVDLERGEAKVPFMGPSASEQNEKGFLTGDPEAGGTPAPSVQFSSVRLSDALRDLGVSPEVIHDPYQDLTGKVIGVVTPFSATARAVRTVTSGIAKAGSLMAPGKAAKASEFLADYWRGLSAARNVVEFGTASALIDAGYAASEGEPIFQSAQHGAQFGAGFQGAIEIARLSVEAAMKRGGPATFALLQRGLDDIAQFAWKNGAAKTPEEAATLAANSMTREIERVGGIDALGWKDYFSVRKGLSKIRKATPAGEPKDATAQKPNAEIGPRGIPATTPVVQAPLTQAQTQAVQAVRTPRPLPYGWQTASQISKSVDLENWAILTADNPQHPISVEGGNESLLQDLLSRGYTPDEIFPVDGFFEGIPSDKGFLVRGISPDEVVDFLTRYGQDSTETRGGLLYNDKTLNPTLGGVVVGQLAKKQKGYSILKSSSGDLPFSINLDFSQKIPHPELAAADQSVQQTEQGLRDIADQYAQGKGITTPRFEQPVTDVDPQEMMKIADAYEALQHNPNDPAVKESYDSLKSEVVEQYNALTQAGYKLEPWTGEGQPYASAEEVHNDIANNKHLFVFMGGEPPADHPLSEAFPGAKGLTYNHIFRFVHDVFGHTQGKFDFSTPGEVNAWREHMRMFSPKAQAALTTETQGQLAANMYGSRLRGPEGEIRPFDSQFAEQKAGLLPEEFSQLKDSTSVQGIDRQIEQIKSKLGELENEIPPETIEKLGALISQRAQAVINEQQASGKAKESVIEKIDKSAEEARQRLSTRFKGKFFDVGGATAESIGSIKDLTAIGVAALARGVKTAEDFARALAAKLGTEAGSVEIPQRLVDRVYRSSVKQFKTLLRNATKSDFPSTEQLLEMFNAGEFGGKWYNRAHEEILRFTGGNEEDAAKFTGLVAALSQSMGPRRNLEMAIEAWWAYKVGDEELLKQAMSRHPYPTAIQNAMRALRGEPFGEKSFKVENFRKNLMGDLQAVTIDRRMKSVFGIPEDSHTGEAMIRNMQEIIKEAAQVVGVQPAEFQAAVWAADGLLNKSEAALTRHKGISEDSAKNFDDIFKEELVAFSEKLKAKGFNLDEKGFARATLVFMMARGLIGAALGYAEGDSTEERLTNALIGSGVGVASPYIIKSLAKIANGLVKRGSIKQVSEILDRTGFGDELGKLFDPASMRKPGVPPPTMKATATTTRTGQAGPNVGAPASESQAQPSPEIVIPEQKPTPTFEIHKMSPQKVKEFIDSNPDAVDIGDRALKINWSEIGDQEQIENILKTLTQLNKTRIDEARRGKQTVAKMKELSRKMGIGFDEIMTRRRGQALNFEESQAFIDFLGSSLVKTRSLIDSLKESPGDPDLEAQFTHQLNVTKMVHEQVMGARAEWGRAGNVWRTTAQGYIEVAGQIATTANTLQPQSATLSKSGLSRMTPTRLALLMDSTLKSTKEISAFIDKATRPGGGDMALEAMYGLFFLSNPKTLGVNALSNAVFTAMHVPERLAAAGVGAVSKQLEHLGVVAEQPDHVTGGEVAAYVYGATNAVKHAMEIAAHAFETGERSFATKLELAPEDAITAENLGLAGPLGYLADFVGNAIRTPLRGLMSTDEFFKVINAFGQVYAKGYRAASAQGFEGDDFAKAVVERFKELPPEDISEAREFADYMTFTQQLGQTGQMMQIAINALPLKYKLPVKFNLPFFTVPVNIFKAAAERVPGLNLLHQTFINDVKSGGSRRDLALGRMITGAALVLTAGYLALQGRINSKAPHDPGERSVQRSAKIQEYAVNLPDGDQYGFDRMDPYGMILGFGADWANIVYGHPNLDLAQRLFLASTLPIAWNLTSKTYLEGATRMLKAISSGEVNDIQQYLKRSSSAAVPAIVRQINSTGIFNERHVRDARGMWDNIISQTPGFSDSVPPDTDIYGHPVFIPGSLGPDVISGIAVSKRKDEPQYKKLVDAKIGLIVPGDFILGTEQADMSLSEPDPRSGIELTPKEKFRYRQLAGHITNIGGKNFEEAIKSLVQSSEWDNATDFLKQSRVAGIYQIYKTKARAELIKETPRLKEEIRSKIIERRNAIVGER